MEVIGVVAASVDILGRSLEVLERARTARIRQKNGLAHLQGVTDDIEATVALLRLIAAEEALHQEHVHQAATHVKQRAHNLYNLIYDLDEKSQLGGGFSRFVDHFIDGQGEQQRLEAMRKDLNDAKTTMIIALQMAQVGLAKSMPAGDVIVNIEVVQQVNERVQHCPGLEQGLRLIQLLSQRAWKDPKTDKWHLTDQDLAELAKPPPYAYKPAPLGPGQTRGVVQDNVVEGSTFIGMGIGKDGGDHNSVYHPTELIVSSNRATGGALFLGGGISAANMVYLSREMPGFQVPTAAAQND
ncbi:hypothetical protein CMUS01_16086 [Colletotrichum musicola]|uniref:NACHT-NTPase and P-loop NTPases N-terminal domain-containing protein n=1 Tax=Colletotrichum musicola TaxID=2175873 RepID=A0A8H6IS08_9PEZI|nr:hypothetical protein CMUS01_16086 [Colletotrichum musicola]